MRCLIVFAKEPKRGKVKTRLSSVFSQQKCLALYKALLKDTLETAQCVPCEKRIVSYEASRVPRYLRKTARPFTFYKQKGRNLGERMHNAFRFATDLDAAKTVIIGSDAPTLGCARISDAFSQLDHADLVLGPSIDGGYYLIALKVPFANLFNGVSWSSESVLRKTLANAKKYQKKVALLPFVRDIDEPRDLEYLKRSLSRIKNKRRARWTRKFLKI